MTHLSLGISSLLPALVTILVAFSTKKVHWAMFAGMLGGALVLRGWAFPGTFSHYLVGSFTDPVRLKIALFVLLVGGMLEVMVYTGASKCLGEFVASVVKTARRARMTAFALIASLFFDDYANVMISGASMRPVMDRYRISPALLAYIADTVAPLASVVLLSTWAAFEISLIDGAVQAQGLQANPNLLFFASLPYHFYTCLSVLLAFLVAFSGKWFAVRLDDGSGLSSARASYQERPSTARKRDILAPLLTLLAVAVLGMFLFGYFLTPPAERGDLSRLLGNAPSIDVLILAVFAALGVMCFSMCKDRVLSCSELAQNFGVGFRGLFPTALIILFAKGLEICTLELGTGNYLTGLLGPQLPVRFIPLLIFLVAAVISVASGFNWSSMVLVMPIAVQMAASGGPTVLAAAIGATISGAIFGAQLIPYSDLSLMTACACGITPVYHVRTQMPQILTSASLACLGYILFAFFVPAWLTLILIAVLLSGVHFLLARESRIDSSVQAPALLEPR